MDNREAAVWTQTVAAAVSAASLLAIACVVVVALVATAVAARAIMRSGRKMVKTMEAMVSRFSKSRASIDVALRDVKYQKYTVKPVAADIRLTLNSSKRAQRSKAPTT